MRYSEIKNKILLFHIRIKFLAENKFLSNHFMKEKSFRVRQQGMDETDAMCIMQNHVKFNSWTYVILYVM